MEGFDFMNEERPDCYPVKPFVLSSKLAADDPLELFLQQNEQELRVKKNPLLTESGSTFLRASTNKRASCLISEMLENWTRNYETTIK